ncbi:MAG: CCA tRNA nucleotidyltransferase [Pseudomonadota bacterium]|nr:CCA tRNA nucleotidyltransferase [Pseudomonadota bacterium]
MAKLLPQADWMRRHDLATLVAALGPGNARYVGGAVRDTMLGLPIKDIDIATPLEPAEVITRTRAAGISTVPTGIAHGTVTAVLPGGPVEITSLRRDVATDGRHATVVFAQAWHEDAARRDFTINALYADPASSEISDFFGGLDDLANHRVRFIGDARARIREDYLRILRYFRFQARFGSLPADADAEAACSELAATLKGLSRERIAMEMMNLLALPDPAPVVCRMASLGVLAVILPEADATALAPLVAAETAQAVAPDALRRLAALLPAQPVLAEQIAARYRLSGAQRKRLAIAAGRDENSEEPRALAYRLGIPSATDRLLLTGGSLDSLRDWPVPVFPLKGGQIVAAGVTAGPQVARILQEVEARWVSEGFPDAARVAELLSEVLAVQGHC